MAPTAFRRRSYLARPVSLPPRGWRQETRRRLEHLIRAGAGQSLPVAFDFDNTLVCGDIGEATLAMLVRTGALRPDSVPEILAPTFLAADGTRISPRSVIDLTAYYEAYLAPTPHGKADSSPLANGYVWAAEAMHGLPLARVVDATRRVFARSSPGVVTHVEVTPGQTAYPVPFFYPEMVDLIAQLLQHDFDVWVISASNVWSVRWMIMHALNPLLPGRGTRRQIRADHVVGVATLLEDRAQRLYKDRVLVCEDSAYARLDPQALDRFRLSSRLQFPVPTYSGKVAALWDALGRAPYLAAGDSPGDLAMLTFAEHRLWIARSDKPKYQAAAAAFRRRTAQGTWLRQPTDARGGSGFQAGSD